MNQKDVKVRGAFLFEIPNKKNHSSFQKNGFLLSLLSDSNQRPRDYKSCALINRAKEASEYPHYGLELSNILAMPGALKKKIAVFAN